MDANQAKEELLGRYPGIERAIEDVRQHAIETGCEKAIVVERGTGRWLNVVEGDAHSITFDLGLDFSNCFLVHSHPDVPSELSSQDYLCAAGSKAEGVLAVCRDGTWSWSHGLQEKSVVFLIFMAAIGRDPASFLRRNRFGSFEGVDSDPRFTIIAHDSNRAMLEEGQIKDYFLLPGAELLEVLGKFGG